MRFIIKVNYGYGDEYQAIDAKDEKEAEKIAFAVWKDGAESQAQYNVVGEWTEELADDYL